MRIIVNVLFVLLNVFCVKSFQCPAVCTCEFSESRIFCREAALTHLPEDIFLEVMHVILSKNLFAEVPRGLAQFKELQSLNLSNNKISTLGKQSLEGLDNLKVLDLSYNELGDWKDIHVESLIAAPSLLELHLSYNPLRGMPDLVVEPLQSNSLETLNLVNCSITNVVGDILIGMPSIKHLNLAENLIMNLNTHLKSPTLEIFDCTHCNLQRIMSDSFLELHSLQTLLLSKNYQLKKFSSKSASLKLLDISHCNLESVTVGLMPNLTDANFRGNHIRYLPSKAFKNTPNLKTIDLSSNAISKVEEDTFLGLNHTESIDLSSNTIPSLSSNTFTTNSKLILLNLSHNYLHELGHFVAEKLRKLDVSFCEVQIIYWDSLRLMPELEELDLSRNSISRLPDGWKSNQLYSLDVSLCRVATINNRTFAEMPQLRNINLAGNRLTSGIKSSFFPTISKLQLDDNPWFCTCESKEFRELYDWLLNQMQEVYQLRCQSPEQMAGKPWNIACFDVWYKSDSTHSDRIWMYSLSFVLAITVLFCIILSVRRAYQLKDLRERELQEIERADTRERLRRMQQQLRNSVETINRNAPDPRELQRPPSYAEAILLPRPDGSYGNLAGSRRSLAASNHSLAASRHSLDSSNPDRTKNRRKRKKTQTKPPGNAEEDNLPLSGTNGANSDTETSLRGVIESDF